MKATALVVVPLLAFAALGCDDKTQTVPPPPSKGRDDAVLAASGTPSVGAKATTSATAAASAAPRKELCNAKPGASLPKEKLKAFAVDGAAEPDAELPLGVGKWVWVNFWAAWCVPCKEEMPLLLAWQKKLGAAGTHIELAFVSIDEDERQLQRFLEKQPADGVKASYWLEEGDHRTSFLDALGKDETPELPLHALVAPSGKVDCLIDGAVEESDYPAVAKLFGAKN